MPNTSRNKTSRCVMARIMRQGESHQKNFTLAEYRTWKAAEAAAEKWLKKIKKELPPPAARYDRKTKRNQSGVVGVFPRIDRFESAIGITDYCRWYARWPGCPLASGISFSTKTFGDEEAFARAYLARENQTVDREWIEKRFKRFEKTKKFQQLLDQKKLQFVDQ